MAEDAGGLGNVTSIIDFPVGVSCVQSTRARGLARLSQNSAIAKMDALRTLVSGTRRRYKDSMFDLDLSYIKSK